MPYQDLLKQTLPGTDDTLETILTDRFYTRINQQVVYSNPLCAAHYIEGLQGLTALTSRKEIEALSADLQNVAEGKAVVLHAGLCVENMDMTPEDVQSYAVDTANMMAGLTEHMKNELGQEILPILRGAGQIAKPRSNSLDNEGKPVFRGGLFHKEGGPGDAECLFNGYLFSEAVLEAARQTGSTISFSHEMLALAYEFGLHDNGMVGSAPFVWIGNRTRDIDGPHVQFAKTIKNPIGLKVDDKITPVELQELITSLNPQQIPGRLSVIFRMAAESADEALPPLLDVMKENGESVIAICDPMHGNTIIDPASGKKTRPMENILKEVKSFVTLCQKAGVHPGGLHLEASADDVTECTDGSYVDLTENYQSLMDPCLNPAQAKQVIGVFAQAYRR